MCHCFPDICGKKQLRHWSYSLDLCRKFFTVWRISVELFVVAGVHTWIFSCVCSCTQSWTQNRSGGMCFICNMLNVPTDLQYISLIVDNMKRTYSVFWSPILKSCSCYMSVICILSSLTFCENLIYLVFMYWLL